MQILRNTTYGKYEHKHTSKTYVHLCYYSYIDECRKAAGNAAAAPVDSLSASISDSAPIFEHLSRYTTSASSHSCLPTVNNTLNNLLQNHDSQQCNAVKASTRRTYSMILFYYYLSKNRVFVFVNNIWACMLDLSFSYKSFCIIAWNYIVWKLSLICWTSMMTQ